jgi:type I restriction-modification system DNA methylase subunit
MPSNFDEAFAAVQSLAKDFDEQKDFYLTPQYQEAEARNDFINKFFFALGWDVYHDLQKHPFKQEVKLEPGVAMGESERRADYAFYVTPHFRKDNVRFFVEAKKPASEIATPDNCFQTIRYGANAGTPLAVLTSFRQLVVLDSRYKLNIDTATKKVVRHYDYADYADAAKFREIFDLLSRDAVAANSLETLAESLASKRGKAVQRGTNEIPIGDAFLQELDTYRGILARAFKNRNPDLDGETLTEITQRTLDRLVFLRFLEDKGIETKESVANFERRGTPWLDFVAASKRLNGIYNGIVFRPHKLDDPDFQVDEDVFASVCKWLSDPRSFYLFDIIPIHTLGSIYEQFLGKVIVTTDKRARVEEKPEVRKAGGVYYTPEYIVRYIVENTVGKLIEGKTPAQIAEMRFADIACGSGSFLLGVFDLLLHYHRDWFNANPDKAKKAGCVQRDDDAWHLSLQQRREILLHNIYGVDIDRQAVEVAQLSLYLKLLEEETTGTAREYQMEFHETLLPSLKDNIVCGNSLIGTDIVSGELFEPVEERKLNPMDFEDRFPQIFRRKISGGELRDAPPGQLDYTMPGVPLHGSFSYKKSKKDKTVPSPAVPVPEFEGGFDVVLGNPPWISLSGKFGNEFLPKTAQEYLIRKYEGNTYMPNMYEYFVRKGLTLTRENGLFGFIVPDRLGFNTQFFHLRDRILAESRIVSLLYKVPFPGITADTLVFIFCKGVVKSSHEVEISEYGHPPVLRKQTDLVAHPERRFEYKIDAKQDAFANRVAAFPCVKPLGEVASCTSGFGGKSQLITETRTDKDHIKTLKGDSIGRYEHRKGYWFEFKRENITGRTTDRAKLGAKPKILLRKTGDSIIATFDDSGIFPEQSLYFLFDSKTQIDFKYLLGVINSKLLNWWFKKSCLTNEKSIAQVKTIDLVKLPIRTIEFSNTSDKSRHDKMVSLVEQMLAAKPQLARAQSDADKEFYGNKCADLDRRIDALVYELYGLTEEEINIVRGTSA